MNFVYGFGQIDWDARIPSTSHVVLMTSHLNGLETFPKKFVGLCESYQFSKDGNRDMEMGQSMPKRCLWTPPKGSFWETFKTFTLMWPVLLASPSVNKTLMMDPNCEKNI
jgi:hypothetical protein